MTEFLLGLLGGVALMFVAGVAWTVWLFKGFWR